MTTVLAVLSRIERLKLSIQMRKRERRDWMQRLMQDTELQTDLADSDICEVKSCAEALRCETQSDLTNDLVNTPVHAGTFRVVEPFEFKPKEDPDFVQRQH